MATDAADRPNPAAELAPLVTQLSFEDLPAGAIPVVEQCFVDTIGVTLAGSVTGAGRIAAEVATETNPGGSATVVGHESRASPLEAAFANGTAAHGLDFDDFSYAYPAHPSATIVPPVLAVAESRDCPGREAVAAYVAGFETYYYLATALDPSHYRRGWHATGTIGTFAAAGAVVNLLEPSVEAGRAALNVAASMPAGTRRNFGTATKPMHAGQAARSGATAALLAAKGFTADGNAIGRENGFLDLYCGGELPDRAELPTPGQDWGILDVGVGTKKYPSSGPTHSSIAAAAALTREHALDPGAIEQVIVTVAPFVEDSLRTEPPRTGLEAKFSMPYCVGAAIVGDRVGLDAFEDEAVERPAVTAIRDRVTVEIDDSLPYNSHRSTVRIETADDSHERTVEHPPGTTENPLSGSELREKFEECASRAGTVDDAGRIYERLESFRDRSVPDVMEPL